MNLAKKRLRKEKKYGKGQKDIKNFRKAFLS